MLSIGTKTLETKRLILRRFYIEDAHDMYQNYASSINVTKYLSWACHKDIKDSEAILSMWIKEYENKDFYQWAIVLKENNQVIGAISVVNIWKELEKCEVGYCLGEEYWNQGIVSEALKKIIDFLFNEVDVKTIIGKHDINNLNSGLVMRRCGMINQGVLKNACKNNKGEYVDCAYYLINNE